MWAVYPEAAPALYMAAHRAFIYSRQCQFASTEWVTLQCVHELWNTFTAGPHKLIYSTDHTHTHRLVTSDTSLGEWGGTFCLLRQQKVVKQGKSSHSDQCWRRRRRCHGGKTESWLLWVWWLISYFKSFDSKYFTSLKVKLWASQHSLNQL